MKKSIILAAIFICITLVSCTVDKSPGDLSETSVNSQVTQSIAASSEVTQPSDVVASSEVVSSNENEIKRDILDQGEHYTIYYCYKNKEVDLSHCYYEILDNDGNYLDFGVHTGLGSVGVTENGDDIELSIGAGMHVHNVRYFDLKTGRVSAFFYVPIASTTDKTAYFDTIDGKIFLIVQDKYSRETYYRRFDRDFSGRVYRTVAPAFFADDGKKITVTYWKGKEETEVTEEFSLFD